MRASHFWNFETSINVWLLKYYIKAVWLSHIDKWQINVSFALFIVFIIIFCSLHCIHCINHYFFFTKIVQWIICLYYFKIKIAKRELSDLFFSSIVWFFFPIIYQVFNMFCILRGTYHFSILSGYFSASLKFLIPKINMI